jgi:hypothetical protein|tara:strand:- start:270 stop:488 length:219 start_codon:yes stop_codon:yes gene_type:complete
MTPTDNPMAYKNITISARKDIIPTMYKGNLYLLNLLPIVPESTADGITACAKISEIAAVTAKKRHAHIIHKA